MTDINKVILIGNLTKDIDGNNWAYVGSNGNATAKMFLSLAVNRSVKKGDSYQNEASFFDVIVWGRLAETLKPYIHKGLKVAVSGYLKQERWTKDNKNFSKIVIVAEDLQLLGKKENSPTNQEQESQEEMSFNDSEEMPF